jgi:hypothetical protein
MTPNGAREIAARRLAEQRRRQRIMTDDKLIELGHQAGAAGVPTVAELTAAITAASH